MKREIYITKPGMRYKKEEVWFPLSEDILSWDYDFHELMLQDKLRMVAYEKAIKEVVKPGMTVVDIGTGTGILAKWALDAGAKKVYGIEVNKDRIPLAVKRMKNAGYSDRFQLFNDLSYKVELPEKVDVILSEILGNLADNEDMTPILNDARKRFLKRGGKILPRFIETFLVPVSSEMAYSQIKNKKCKGVNKKYNLQDLLSKLEIKNQFDIYYDVVLPKGSYLGKPKIFQKFGFNGKDRAIYKTKTKFKIIKSGLFTGFKGFFIAKLSNKTVLDISGEDIIKRKTSDCWKHCYMSVEDPFMVNKGDIIVLNYSRYYPQKRNSPFRQCYSWNGEVARNKKTIYKFNHKMC